MADPTDITWDKTVEMAEPVQPQAMNNVWPLLNPDGGEAQPFPGMVNLESESAAFLPLVNPNGTPMIDLSIPPIPRDGVLYPQFVRKINEGTAPPSQS